MRINLETGLKWCPACDKNKEPILFYKDKTDVDGFYIYCKECTTAKMTGKNNTKLQALRDEVTEGYKRCFRCNFVLPVDSFTKDKSKGNGLSGYCKKCHYRWKVEQKSKTSHQLPMKYNAIRQSARSRHIYFDLEKDWYINFATQFCYYCGQPCHGGLDRIDNEQGYIATNVVTCCPLCNRMKMDMILSDFINHIHLVASKH